MTTMTYATSAVSGKPACTRSIEFGAKLTTATSTLMTVLLLASMGQGMLSVSLLAASGLGFELLKWNSWQDALKAHHGANIDRRNVFGALCTVAVVLSIGASVATTRSNLAVSSADYLRDTQQQELIISQIAQKQTAIDVCMAANRVTLCAMPLQAEVSELQGKLAGLVVSAPDEATALIMEVSKVSGLDFDGAVTLVVLLISVMLDASGLYFLFKTTMPDSDNTAAWSRNNEMPVVENRDNTTSASGDTSQHINLSVTLGVDETLRQALKLISSGSVRPSIRSLSESLDVPQHTAQTILHWLAEAGHLQKQGRGKGYSINDSRQGDLI